MIDLADDLPVLAILDHCEHISEICFSELRVNSYDSGIVSDITHRDLIARRLRTLFLGTIKPLWYRSSGCMPWQRTSILHRV